MHIALRMRGREQAFADRAYKLVQEIITALDGKVEQYPSKLGNQITATVGAATPSKE